MHTPEDRVRNSVHKHTTKPFGTCVQHSGVVEIDVSTDCTMFIHGGIDAAVDLAETLYKDLKSYQDERDLMTGEEFLQAVKEQKENAEQDEHAARQLDLERRVDDPIPF